MPGLKVVVIDPMGSGNMEIETDLAQCLPLFGACSYTSVKEAFDKLYFEPNLIILHNASEGEIMAASQVPKWKGRVICVTEADPSVHHRHVGHMHFCDLSNLGTVAKEAILVQSAS